MGGYKVRGNEIRESRRGLPMFCGVGSVQCGSYGLVGSPFPKSSCQASSFVVGYGSQRRQNVEIIVETYYANIFLGLKVRATGLVFFVC